MLDLRLIRRDPDAVRAGLARRGPDAAGRIDELLALDAQWREATTASEQLRAEQKTASEGIAAAKRAGEDASAALARMKDVSAQVKALGERARESEERLQAVLVTLPNLPDPTAADEDEVLREVGDAAKTGRDHLELAGERIDMERGARLSGSRFAYLRGDLVMLELALVRLALTKLRGHGFEPVIPPVLVREEALYGTGFLPDTEQQIYHLPEDDLYLVGTSEVALASLHAGRDPRASCRCATRASRPASGARRAPRARTRAGSSACTSSTRSRCSRSSRRRSRPASTSACWRSRRRSSASSRSPTAS